MSTDDFVKYQRDRSQSDFEILRSRPKICTLIEKIHSNTMNQQIYPFVTPPKHAKKEKNKEKKPAKGAETFSMLADGSNESDLLENPRIFVYVVGGLSHHEMCAIAEQQTKIKA